MECALLRKYMVMKCIDVEMLTAVNIHRDRKSKLKNSTMENCRHITTFLSTCEENVFLCVFFFCCCCCFFFEKLTVLKALKPD